MNFTVYKSSAGSGKTFTLVKEYLKIALSTDDARSFRHILAITFTNKASAEMKVRIISALKDLSSQDASKITSSNETLKKILLEELQLPPLVLQSRAKKTLGCILHHYSDFAIGTIDSFVHRVVRTFAHDLHLPLNFEIELDADKLLSEAIDLLISKIGADEKLTRAMIELAEAKIDDEKSWHIEHDLFLFAKNLLDENGRVHLEQLKDVSIDDFFQIRDTLFAKKKKFEDAVSLCGKKGFELIKNAGINHSFFYQGAKGIGKYFENLANKDYEKIKPNSYVQTTLADGKWHSEKTTDKDKSNIDAIKSQLTNLFLEIQTLADKGYAEYVLYALLYKNIYSLAVLNEIEKLLEQFKEENGIIHISEFNKIISKIVLSQPTPFIYERLGTRFKNFLIDEFQDTSILQWQNLLPLVDNALAENNFNLVVGDSKQAIYRWRGGDVKQFSQLPKVTCSDKSDLIKQREESLTTHFKGKILNKNFRSKAEIVDFNNKFFRHVSSALEESHRTIYDSLEQEFNPENRGGYVSLEFIRSEDENFAALNFRKTLSLIRDAQADNYEFSNIVILCRGNKEASAIANFLTENKIPVVSSESLLLKNSSEINFIECFFRFLVNPIDNIAKTALAVYLSKSGDMKEELSHSQKSFVKELNRNGFEINLYRLRKLSLIELGEETVRIFRLHEEKNLYVSFFLDEIMKFSSRFGNNLNEFLEWWKERKEKSSLVISESVNAVRIMTIHKSKGLEFPVVILPFANWGLINEKNAWIEPSLLEFPKLKSALLPLNKSVEETVFATIYREEKSKTLLDNINLLYVAMTRPINRLHVLTSLPSEAISKFFIEYLTKIKMWGGMERNSANNRAERASKTFYEFGMKTKKENNSLLKTAPSFQLEKFHSENWRSRIKIRQESSKTWNTETGNSALKKGIALHYALSLIESEEDVDISLEKLSAEGILNEEEKISLKNKVKSLFSKPDIKKFFAKGLFVKNESEIVDEKGESHRPDRVIIENNNAKVIDFKTGKKLKEYEAQLRKYELLLKQIGFNRVEKYIIYTEEEILETIE